MELPSRPHLAVTYASDRLQDGAGAQLQRIYGIYALSRALAIPYVHTPIEHLGYHGLLALENNAPTRGLLSECNRVFHIPSDIELPETGVISVQHEDVDAAAIWAMKNAGGGGASFHLVRILFPYPFTDRNPESYRFVKALSPFPYSRSEVFRLAIHVRRGEVYAFETARMLPNSFYVGCASRVAAMLEKLGIPFVCELYTEEVTKRFEVTPDHHGVEGRISENVTFEPGMNQLEDFDVLPNLVRYINGDPIETLGRMATADALIMSRSSFSYVAAILSQNCTVICYPFWHSAMEEWLVPGADGTLDEGELAGRLESWKLTPV
jgi:hypothetical protein